MLNIKIKILILIIALIFCLFSISWRIAKTECNVITNETIESLNADNSDEMEITEFNINENTNTTNSEIEVETNIDAIPENTTQISTESQNPKDPFYSNIHTALNDLNNKTTKNADTFANNAKIEIDSKNKKIILKSNISITKKLVFSKDCKIELNGYTITLSDSAYFEIEKNVNVSFSDKIGTGAIKKENGLSDTTHLIVNNGNLIIDSGTYKINNNNVGTTIMIYHKEGTVCINNGTFDVTTTNAYGYILKSDGGKTLKINGGSFNMSSQSGNLHAIKTYPPITKQEMNITIKGGKFDIYSKNGNTQGLDLHRGNELYINNCYVKTHTVKSINSVTTASIALDFTMFKNAHIDGGTFMAIESDKTTDYDSLGLYESGNNNVVINGGKFFGNTSYSASSLIINDAIFSGIHSGLQLYGKGKVIINGGIYESPWHGGTYASGKELHIQNAILGSPKWKESHFGKETDFQPQYEDGKYWDGTLYSCMYIGGPNNDVVVYMNNCKLAYTENLTTEYSIVLTSNHGHCNSALYISNTDAIKKIRVDGENDKGCKGNLYIKENVTYKGVYGKGYVETPKTAPLLNS